MKICRVCKVEKPLGDFYRNRSNKDGYNGACKICASRICKAHYEKHKEVYKLRAKNWADANRPRRRQIVTAYQRGMSVDERETFLEERDFRCEVCGLSRDESYLLLKRDLCIDHCHLTEKNKGVLCILCNAAAGSCGDDPLRVFKLFEYLHRTRDSL